MAVKTDDLLDTEWKVVTCLPRVICGKAISHEINSYSCPVKPCVLKCADYDCKIEIMFFIFMVYANHKNIFFTMKISRSMVLILAQL